MEKLIRLQYRLFGTPTDVLVADARRRLSCDPNISTYEMVDGVEVRVYVNPMMHAFSMIGDVAQHIIDSFASIMPTIEDLGNAFEAIAVAMGAPIA